MRARLALCGMPASCAYLSDVGATLGARGHGASWTHGGTAEMVLCRERVVFVVIVISIFFIVIFFV
jgi:hypothetical protein